MITGCVHVDLTGVPRDRQRIRLHAALATAPVGARVVVVVGPLAAEPEAVRILREHEPRLLIELAGEVSAVRRWLDAVRLGVPGEAVPLW